MRTVEDAGLVDTVVRVQAATDAVAKAQKAYEAVARQLNHSVEQLLNLHDPDSEEAKAQAVEDGKEPGVKLPILVEVGNDQYVLFAMHGLNGAGVVSMMRVQGRVVRKLDPVEEV